MARRTALGPSSGMRDINGMLEAGDDFRLRVDRAGQEADEAEHEHVEHQPDDELVGGQPVAHVGLDGGDHQAGNRREQQPDPGRVGDVGADRGRERAASIIASSEMLMVPAFSAISSPEAANSNTTAAMMALRYALSLVAMSPSAEKKSPTAQTLVLVAASARRRSRT